MERGSCVLAVISIIRPTYLYASIPERDLNVKYGHEVRQFWKQCRDRGERRGRGERELRSRTLESQSPMVSCLRVARVSREPCEGTYHYAAVTLTNRVARRADIFPTIFET